MTTFEELGKRRLEEPYQRPALKRPVELCQHYLNQDGKWRCVRWLGSHFESYTNTLHEEHGVSNYNSKTHLAARCSHVEIVTFPSQREAPVEMRVVEPPPGLQVLNALLAQPVGSVTPQRERQIVSAVEQKQKRRAAALKAWETIRSRRAAGGAR